MADQGAQMQKYVTELVKQMENLRLSRQEIIDQLEGELNEQNSINADIEALESELGEIDA